MTWSVNQVKNALRLNVRELLKLASLRSTKLELLARDGTTKPAVLLGRVTIIGVLSRLNLLVYIAYISHLRLPGILVIDHLAHEARFAAPVVPNQHHIDAVQVLVLRLR